MVKKSILTVFFVLLLTNLSYAVNLVFPCSDGGLMTATGTFDPSTGAFDISTLISNCSENGVTKNGTVHSSGTLNLVSTAVTMTTQYSVTAMHQDTGDAVSFNCSQFINGTYDIATALFDGSITSGCNGSGNLTVTLEDALSTLMILL